MDISQVNLRKAVLANFTDSTTDDLRSTVLDAVSSGEDKILPGLGVLFEVLWENSNAKEKEKIIQTMHKGIH